MFGRRRFLNAATLASVAAITHSAAADDPAASTSSTGGAKWRAPSAAGRLSADSANAPGAQPLPAAPSAQPIPGASTSSPGVTPASVRQPIARVTPGPNSLPNDAGQEWRDYDIGPYTARVTSTNRPEQAIVDWVLRETGYNAWHSEVVAVLNADRRTLHVYHTPQIHAVVSDMVDRFVNTEAESQAFGMRVVTVGSPNWRTKAHKMLHAVSAQTPGVQAWLMAKEDAALMQADLRKRSDFQEHSTPHLLVNNGQSTMVSKIRARNYIRDVTLRSEAWPGFEPQTGQFDEGFKLEFHPLLSLDGRTVDAVLKCEIDQVEKMIAVNIDVPTAVAPRQQTKVEVPQLISSRLHERFRWPADQVLLISLGVVPTPVPQTSGLKVPLLTNTTRADLLVFVENNGKVGAQPTALQPPPRQANNYRDRY
jgi:hypothetical protein